MNRPQQVNRKNAASYPLSPGRFYIGVVTSVASGGKVTVKIPKLNSSFGPVVPVGTTPINKILVGDAVVCTFADESFSDLIIFGSSNVKADVFASKVEFQALQASVTSLAARVTALENA